MALPDSVQALQAARKLYRRWGDHLVYGWQIEGRLGLAFLAAGEPEKALPHLENIARRQPNAATHHRNLGAALLQMQRRGRALSEYRLAVELEPGNAVLRREYGQILLSFGDTGRAATEFAVAGELCGGCPELDQPLAALYLKQQDFRRAIPPLQRLYGRDSRPERRRILVSTLIRAGEDSSLVALVGALPACDRSADEWRALVEAEQRLGGSAHARLAAAMGLGESVSGISAVAEVAPFWGHVALSLLAAGEYESGLAAVDRAIRLDPDNVAYRNNRVVLLTRLGRDPEARAEWERVLTLDPSAGQRSP